MAIVKTKTYNFDTLLLREAGKATSPVAVGPLIRLAKEAGSRGTARELEAIQKRLGRTEQSSGGDNYGYPDDYRPLGGWSIEN
ncbi:MAG: hypothetical protein PVJ86_08785 [Phycisphaerales bacterium]|jgi:hypothetical protein